LGIKYIGIFFALLISGTPAIAQEKAVDNSSGDGAAALRLDARLCYCFRRLGRVIWGTSITSKILGAEPRESKEETVLRRMMRCLLVPIAASVFLASGAVAEITPKYLDGVWAIASEKNCGLKEFEQLVFHANGTFESHRFDATGSVGFWRNSGDVLTLHLVTSPERFDKQLKDFKGYFDYFNVKVLIFNQEPNKFEAFGLIGNQIKKEVLFRCKG